MPARGGLSGARLTMMGDSFWAKKVVSSPSVTWSTCCLPPSLDPPIPMAVDVVCSAQPPSTMMNSAHDDSDSVSGSPETRKAVAAYSLAQDVEIILDAEPGTVPEPP